MTLARRIALQSWRLERLRRFETALARDRIARIDEPGGVDSIVEETFKNFLEAARDREAFEAIARMNPFETVPAPIAIRILKRIADVNRLELDEADLAVEGGIAAADNPEAARWPASEVVRLAADIAAEGGMHPSPALMLSMNSATRSLDARGPRLRDLREQRLLPEGRDLEVLQRYEAGLERSLFRTMHELERLQAHRNGGEVPVPAVLDLTVESGSTAA